MTLNVLTDTSVIKQHKPKFKLVINDKMQYSWIFISTELYGLCVQSMAGSIESTELA